MASIKVSLLADSKSLERGFKTSTKAAEKFNRSMGTTAKGAQKQKAVFAGLGRTIVGLGAGYLGARGLISVVRASFEEMSQSAKVTAQTNAVLKSTGGVAGVTAGHVDRLGAALLRKSGIDDETIRSGENMILTFRNIRNSAGQGNDIFDRTTKATLDMDAAMTHGNVTQESLSKSAIRVGKALNDPIKGVTALRRVGVAFTEEQTKQISAMVKSGNVIGAQKVILAELNAEFGGSAAAMGGTLPGKINILRESFRNLGGSLATSLVPALTKLVDSANKWITNTENVKRVQDTFKQIVSGVTSVLRALRGVLNGVNTVTGSTARTVKLLVGAFVIFKALSMAAAVSRVAGSFGLLRRQAALATVAVEANTVASKTGALSTLGTTAGGKTFGKAGGLTTVATTAATATKRVSRLKTLLGALRAQPIIPITIAAVVLMNKKPIDNFLKGHGLGVLARHDKGLVPLLKDAATSVLGGKKQKFEGGGSIGGLKEFLARAKPKKPKPIFGKVSNVDTRAADAALAKDAADLKIAKRKAKVNFEQRNQFFDALIGRRLNRVQDISGTGGQLAELKKIGAEIKARIAATKDITRKLTLEDQLLDITRQEKGIRADQAAAKQQARQEAAAKKQAAAEKRIALAEKRRAALTAKQFFTLGLDATGGERVPFKKTLQRQLGTLSGSVKGTFLDTPKTRSLLARIRKVLKQGIVPTDVRAKVKEMLDGVNDELKNHAAGNRTKFRAVDTDKVLTGLGLSPKQMKIARARLSRVGAGNVPAGGRGAFGVAVAQSNTVIHVDGRRDDAEAVARKVSEAQRKHAKRNTVQRRGR